MPSLAHISVRWVALGALAIFVVVFAADRALTAALEAHPESAALLQDAFARLEQGIDDTEKAALRQQVMQHLPLPWLGAVALVVFVAIAAMGALLGLQTTSHWNAVLAALFAALAVSLHMLGEFSTGALVLTILLLTVTAGSSLMARWWMRRWHRRRSAPPTDSAPP
ncbi:MAG: hypothetical protein M0R76_10450 [Proteobacteria bacterium]|nr:hypothetical protein [Pseudomonadota bacterium]